MHCSGTYLGNPTVYVLFGLLPGYTLLGYGRYIMAEVATQVSQSIRPTNHARPLGFPSPSSIFAEHCVHEQPLYRKCAGLWGRCIVLGFRLLLLYTTRISSRMLQYRCFSGLFTGRVVSGRVGLGGLQKPHASVRVGLGVARSDRTREI